MVRIRRRAMVGGLMGLALVAAACGGSSSDETATGTVDEGIKKGVDDAIGGSTTTAVGTATTAPAKIPTSMDEWETLWAKEREAIVKRAKDEKWGLAADAKSVTGPAGFKIDLSKCPAGWSNTEGLTDTEVKIGHTTVLSGTLADYGNIAKALTTYADYYNGKGAFKDANGKTRKLNFVIKDDGYDPARTIPLVDELIDSEKVFAMWTLGSANTMKTYDKLNQRCIPQPLSMTGHPAWGDPVNHPWTTGMQLAYNTEAVLWGSFIEKRLSEFPGGKVKVASLVMNNDFGKSYDGSFKAYLAQSPNKANIEYISETVEATAPTLKDPMTTLASKSPDIFIAMTAGAPCVQTITESAENGMHDKVKYLFQPSVCKSASFVGKDKVGGDGSASNGWWIVGGGVKDFNSPAYDNGSDPFIKWARELLATKGIDYKTSGSFGSGIGFAFPAIQAFIIAGQLDGGLTRTNLILALRGMDITRPDLLPGAKFNMNGNKDSYLVEASEFAKYDSSKQQWIQQGDLIELSGKSTNCAWEQSTGTCKVG